MDLGSGGGELQLAREEQESTRGGGGSSVLQRLLQPARTARRPACLPPECCNNQKLLLEYEKYQELQLKSQRMQEEYEKQLRDNDETKSQALEELTEFYEAKLQEKTSLLEEVIPGSRALPPFRRQRAAWIGLGWGGN